STGQRECTFDLRAFDQIPDPRNCLVAYPPALTHSARAEPRDRANRGGTRGPDESTAQRHATDRRVSAARRRDGVEVGDQLVGSLVAMRRLLLEALHDETPETRGSVGPRDWATAGGGAT